MSVPTLSNLRPALLPTLGLALQFCCVSSAIAGEIRANSATITNTVEMKMDLNAGGCKAELQLEYFQRGENAEVTSTLNITECAAASGEYIIVVRYRGDDGEQQSGEYSESWSRADASPIAGTRQYYIGESVDLIRVTSRGLKCVCTSTDEDQSVPGAGED